jgi:hypothetical protein
MRGPEGNIQDKIKENGKRRGWRVRKRSTPYPGVNGEPDLEFARLDQEIWFMEVKAPGKHSTPLQVERQNELIRCGFIVYECDDVEDGKLIVGCRTKHGTNSAIDPSGLPRLKVRD